MDSTHKRSVTRKPVLKLLWHGSRVILSVWAIGIPIRFITWYFRMEGALYRICPLDLLVDWVPLFILGIVTISDSLYRYFKECEKACRKGISHIISQLLLILMTVGLCVILYSFLVRWMNNMFDFTDSMTDEFRQMINQTISEFMEKFGAGG